MPPERSIGVVPRRHVLAFALCSLFVGFFVAAEILGAKLFAFTLFGLGPRDIGLGDGERFVATAGVIAFPMTFVMTDIVNEYFGRSLVRVFTLLAIGVNLLLQPVIQGAIPLPAVSFTASVSAYEAQRAFEIALGQSWNIVLASLLAFAVAQLLDAHVFTLLRRKTGGRWLWLRAQGSTVVSQLVDTLAVIFAAFVFIPAATGGDPWTLEQAAQVSLTNYVYKFAIAVGVTPLLYVVHGLVDLYLGHGEARALIEAAHATRDG
jgi:hypothetical protein